MKEIGWIFSKIKWRFLHMSREKANDFFRREGIKVGNNCRINCNILTAESYLIELGDNVTISDHVSFITHDNSISKIVDGKSDLFGKIKIGDNCFIGAHSILMYGVSLPNNTIVASGSVVCKSIDEEYKIIGGNPARIIGDWDKFAQKSEAFGADIKGMTREEKKEALLNGDIVLVSR